MMRVANNSMYANPTGYLNAADAVPSDSSGYVFVPAAVPPGQPDTFLTIDTSGNLSFQPKGEQSGVHTQYFQLSGNFLIAEMSGVWVIGCWPGIL